MPPIKTESLARLYWSLVFGVVLAALLVGATYWFAAREQSDAEWMRHTLVVRNQIARTLMLVQRAESGQRGYLLTGNEIYLRPYEQAIKDLPAALNKLSALVIETPPQQQFVGSLRQLTTDKLRELQSTITARKAGNAAAALALVNDDSGQRMMNDIRALTANMEREEDNSLEQRQTSARTFGALLQFGVGAAFLLICLAGLLGSLLTRRSFLETATANDRLATANEQLVQQINQREVAEGRLRQAQKMEAIGQLSGGVAHDFNNMLGVISGSLELMRKRFAKGDFGVERHMDAAMEAAKRCAALTHRLLAFARQQPLEPKPLDANRMIARMSELLRTTLGEQIGVETVSAGGLWAVKADQHQLENAILNLAINSRDAMAEGGSLTIETANTHLDEAYARTNPEVEAGQFVMIAISDTGAGMPPETIARAFDPFFTTKAAGTGTGLGLSQVFGFVKQSRGHIKIYSEVEAGTTVKIYLPRFVGDAKEIELAPSIPTQNGSEQEVILVVEDDTLMRRMSTEGLRELGYTALDCDGAAQALSVLDSRTDVRLLFTDIVMPEINGKKLADEALRRRPDLKVIYTTGYTGNAVVHGGILDPGVELLSKPFTLDQLAAKVRSVLDKT
jgi:signal transduction histidine kinase